jgi:hypothetical protein
MLHTCWCIVFEVFEFKFSSEFICFLLFKNRKPFLLLSPSFYPIPARFCFEPKPAEVHSRPSYSFSAAARFCLARPASPSDRPVAAVLPAPPLSPRSSSPSPAQAAAQLRFRPSRSPCARTATRCRRHAGPACHPLPCVLVDPDSKS